eukprot:g5084.t1
MAVPAYSDAEFMRIWNQDHQRVTDEVKRYVAQHFYKLAGWRCDQYYMPHESENDPDDEGEVCASSGGVLDQAKIKDKSQLLTYLPFNQKPVKKWFMQEHSDRYKVVWKKDQSKVKPYEINTFPGVKHTYKPYKELDEETRRILEEDVLRELIHDILCGGNDDQYQHVLKWIATVAQLKRTQLCLIIKSAAQGIGKSTLPNLLVEHVFGHAVCCDDGNNALEEQFNAEMEGKIFVFLDEINETQNMKIRNKFYRWVTAPKLNIREMYKGPRPATNHTNMMICTNHATAFKGEAGRRTGLVDPSPHRHSATDEGKQHTLMGSRCWRLVRELKQLKLKAGSTNVCAGSLAVWLRCATRMD